jgi:hypothetical protein
MHDDAVENNDKKQMALRCTSPNTFLDRRWVVLRALIAAGKRLWKFLDVVITAGAVAAATKIGTDHAEDLLKRTEEVIRWLVL